MSATTATETALPAIDGRRRTVAMWVILLAFFMDLLDTTIVNIAVPSIQRELGTSYSAVQWIIAGYALTFALFLITGGRLGDILGYKRLFLTGIAGFALASALCGLAVSSEMLVGARLVQGLCAALMVPQILSTIQVMYTSYEERQGVSAFYGALAGLATVAGPIIGALLISGSAFGWRAIFLINLPVAVVALVLGIIYLPDRKSPHPLHLDVVGLVLILIAMSMLMFPLIEGRQLGWPAWSLLSMAASVIVFVVFGASQVRKDRRDGSPLVVPHLFKAHSFSIGIIIALGFYAAVSSFFLVFTLYVQIGLGYPVLEAGLTGIPFSLGVSVAAGLSGPVLVPRFGRAVLTFGPITLAASFALLIAEIAAFGNALTPWELAPVLLLGGLGMGCVVAPIYPFILAEVQIKDAGSASGVINTVGQVGGAIGVAVIGVIFFGLMTSQATVSADSVRTDLTTELTRAGLPLGAVSQAVASFVTCFHDRVTGRDPQQVPPSCAAAQKGEAAFAASDPGLATKVGPIMARQAATATERNFGTAMTRTLWWQIGGLIIVTLLTFLLPKRPRRPQAPSEGGQA